MLAYAFPAQIGYKRERDIIIAGKRKATDKQRQQQQAKANKQTKRMKA